MKGEEGKVGTNLLKDSKDVLLDAMLVKVRSNGADDVIDDRSVHSGLGQGTVTRGRARRRMEAIG
jgi:hypothetical protein